MENLSDLIENFEKLGNVHYSSGPIHQRLERLKAQLCFSNNELETIYHLVESHIPSLRLKTVLRYESILTSAADNAQLSLCKNHVASNCTNTKIEDNVDKLLAKIKEMPPEWTLVQLTPHFNPMENLEIDVNKHYTNSLYISVFNCGPKGLKPFCVSVDAPVDGVSGAPIELIQEIYSIITENKSTLTSSKNQTHFKGLADKQSYHAKRKLTDDRLRMLVNDLQDMYLKEWKCFMIGKYVDASLETKIQNAIKSFFRKEAPSFNLNEKTLNILCYLVKSAGYLKLAELRRALTNIIPGTASNKQLLRNLAPFVRKQTDELKLMQQKRHPLILIIDDSLDCLPWEMMDILADVPVSRLPSLHLAYALFQEHKPTIRDGFKIIQNSRNGTYLVNPDLDLKNMQNRMTSFYRYWLPDWKGISGVKPSEKQFENMLVSSDIFSYNGHGSGAHFFPVDRIEQIRINAVVLLFGCGSTKLNVLGPQTEMYGTYQMYLIACSPCIVGMLWEVTDLDTDILTTQFLCQWIPSPSKAHWKCLDKGDWMRGEKVDFSVSNVTTEQTTNMHEPELLKALSLAKKSNLLTFYLTKAACVARGIPIKISS